MYCKFARMQKCEFFKFWIFVVQGKNAYTCYKLIHTGIYEKFDPYSHIIKYQNPRDLHSAEGAHLIPYSSLPAAVTPLAQRHLQGGPAGPP